MRYMEEEHLVYRLTIKCEFLGVHETNRNGMGVDLAHMAELMESIAAMGYVDHGGRICVELDSSADSELTRHHDKWSVLSGKKVKRYKRFLMSCRMQQ